MACAFAFLAAITLSGCGGSKSPSVASVGRTTSSNAAGSTNAAGSGSPSSQTQLQQDALKFSHCMRSHGIKDFPNPTASGFIGTGGSDPNAPRFLAAQGACNHYLPAHPAGS